jgi:hypothetical protein
MQATALRFLLMGLKSGTAPVNRKALVRAAAALSHIILDAILLLQLSVKYVLVMPGPSRGCSVLGAICTKRASSTGRLMKPCLVHHHHNSMHNLTWFLGHLEVYRSPEAAVHVMSSSSTCSMSATSSAELRRQGKLRSLYNNKSRSKLLLQLVTVDNDAFHSCAALSLSLCSRQAQAPQCINNGLFTGDTTCWQEVSDQTTQQLLSCRLLQSN